MKLRDYQHAAIDQVRRKMAAGTKRIAVVAPCGSGKTIVACDVIRRALERGRRVVFLAHRAELIDQAQEKLAKFGIASSVLMASDRRRNDALDVSICSIQTLARRIGPSEQFPRIDRMPPADVVIVDECHHCGSDSYRRVLGAWRDAVVLGLTATPWRSDRVGLRGTFEESVLVATYEQLIADGSLVPYDAFAYNAPRLHDVPVVAGDWNQKALGIATNTSVLVGEVVKEYLDHALGKRAIVFAVNIEHSNHLVGQFNAAGVAARHVDFNTPKIERREAIEAFARGDVRVLSSVAIFTEGWDSPAAEVAILARPTMSLSLFLQMAGRVLRPSEGKARALLHDHGGNFLRHGLIEDPRDYTLTTTPKRVIDLHTCPLCHSVFSQIRDDGSCPTCHELIAPPREVREANERQRKEQIEGERINAERIRELRQQQAANAPESRKLAYYQKLTAEAEAKSYKPGWIGMRFKLVFGHWPQFKGAA